MLMYKSQKWYIRREVKQTLNSSKTLFEKMTLSLSEFNDSKVNEKEILYKGNMYDIKSISLTDTLIELLVINDKAEKGIIDRITHFVKQSNDSKSNFPAKLFQFLSLTYLPNSSNHSLHVFASAVKFSMYSTLAPNSTVKDIVTPPPRWV